MLASELQPTMLGMDSFIQHYRAKNKEKDKIKKTIAREKQHIMPVTLINLN